MSRRDKRKDSRRHKTSKTNPSNWRMFWIALAWQAIPAAYLLWDAWDSPSTWTMVLRVVVFLGVPVISGLVHRSWRIGFATLLLPVLAFGVMFTVFMLIMPSGKW